MNDNLSNIEVGDKVLVFGHWVEEIETVIKTGSLVGSDSWHRCWIRVPTETDFARVRLNQLRRTLNKRLRELQGDVDVMGETTITKLLERLNLSKELS